MKFAGWLGKALLLTVIVSTMSVVTTWTMMNMYMDQILKNFSFLGAGEKVQMPDLLSQLSATLSPGQSTSQTASSANADINGQGDQAADSSTTGPTGSDKDSSDAADSQAAQAPADSTAAQSEEPKDAVPVFSQQSLEELESSKDESGSQKVVISAEQFNKEKEGLSDDDKMKVFSILISRLPQPELQKLSQMIEDGITQQELTQIQQMVKKYVKPDEYDELMKIVGKY